MTTSGDLQTRFASHDEATSDLDDESASAFGGTINQLRGKVTILMIAHKLPANLQRMETVYLTKPKDKT